MTLGFHVAVDHRKKRLSRPELVPTVYLGTRVAQWHRDAKSDVIFQAPVQFRVLARPNSSIGRQSPHGATYNRHACSERILRDEIRAQEGVTGAIRRFAESDPTHPNVTQN